MGKATVSTITDIAQTEPNGISQRKAYSRLAVEDDAVVIHALTET